MLGVRRHIGQQFLVVALQYVTPLADVAPALSTRADRLAGVASAPRRSSPRAPRRPKLIGISSAPVAHVLGLHGVNARVASAACPRRRRFRPARDAPWQRAGGNLLPIVQCTSARCTSCSKHTLSSSANYPPIAVAGMLYYGAGAVALAAQQARLAVLVHPAVGLGRARTRDPDDVRVQLRRLRGSTSTRRRRSSPPSSRSRSSSPRSSPPSSSATPTVSDLVGGLAIIAGLASVTVGRAARASRDARAGELARGILHDGRDGRRATPCALSPNTVRVGGWHKVERGAPYCVNSCRAAGQRGITRLIDDTNEACRV